jgi:hypothetical protein
VARSDSLRTGGPLEPDVAHRPEYATPIYQMAVAQFEQAAAALILGIDKIAKAKLARGVFP